jgi:hypothetical protein
MIFFSRKFYIKSSLGSTHTCALAEILFPICFNLRYNDSKVCNGNGNLNKKYLKFLFIKIGNCTSDDHRECNFGYFGNDCEIKNCFGILSNDSNVCSGNGNCTSKDKMKIKIKL